MLSALTSLFSRWRHPGTDALSEYLDSMLSPRRQAQVARHLESCDGCQAELASLQLTVGLLQRVPQVEPPRSFIFTAPPLVERPRRPQGALNWALAGAGASLALLLAVVLSADMVGVLRGDDGESAQQEASPGSDASIAATQAIADMMADPPPQAVMAPAAAPPPASAPTPPAPAVERYTRPPVEPIEEAEPPAGVVAEDISALISQFAAADDAGRSFRSCWTGRCRRSNARNPGHDGARRPLDQRIGGRDPGGSQECCRSRVC